MLLDALVRPFAAQHERQHGDMPGNQGHGPEYGGKLQRRVRRDARSAGGGHADRLKPEVAERRTVAYAF
ncbi:MAG TPA: hypothetical protein PK958_17170 [Rhodocyclaceae bacterium]|nr:hypothetical protein [Rhodocyclaceae bacterium]